MDTTAITTIWKPIYGDLVMALQVLTPEWANLKQLKGMSPLSMRSINWPVDLSIGGGIAFTTSGGSTARPSSNAPVEATDSWTHLVGRFEIDFDTLEAQNDSRFASAETEKQLRYQSRDKARSFRRTIGVGFYGYPDATLFEAEGTVSNPSGNTTRVRVNNLYGVSGLAVPSRIRDYMTVNKDYVNVHSGATSTVRGGGLLTAINETTNDLDLATSSYIGASISAGDAIVLNNQIAAGSADDFGLGLNGMLHLTRATTVHNISSSAQPDWVAGVDQSAYGAALAGTDLYKWFEEIEQRSDYPVEFCWTTTGVIAAGGGAELDQRRYSSEDDTMRLGFKKLNSMGVIMEGRPYCPAGYLFMGSSSALQKIAPDEDVRDVIEAGDKAGTFKQYDNGLGFFTDKVLRTQMAVVSRLGLGVVDGITEA